MDKNRVGGLVVGWFVGWVVGWLVGWLVGLLGGCVVGGVRKEISILVGMNCSELSLSLHIPLHKGTPDISSVLYLYTGAYPGFAHGGF